MFRLLYSRTASINFKNKKNSAPNVAYSNDRDRNSDDGDRFAQAVATGGLVLV